MNKEKKAEKREAMRQVIDEICKSNAVYVMSFIVPLIIMIAIYIMRKIAPFGENIYLRSDMYHQYAPFFSSLWDKIRTGGSMQFTWDVGMGSNYVALFGYYLSSPTNWFIALFPKEHIPAVMDYIILLKLSLSSFTFAFYLCNHKKQKNMSAAIFGLFYAFCGFVTAYSWNLMWLDCVLLLPLVVLGLEKLVNEGKGLLYVITLGMTILSNYYIAIMVCISMVLYFIVTMVSREVPEHKSEYIKATLRFIGYSVLAGAFAAVLLFPEMAALEYTASSKISFPKTMSRYFSFITMFKRQLINVDVHLGLEHYPNIYCGVMAFVLLPLYIMSKKISKREKTVKMIILFVFLTAFNMNIPNFIWHGFHFPNSLPCRQSFIYCFILLGMCYDAFTEIHEYKSKQISGSMWGVIIFLVYLGNSLIEDDIIDFRSIYLSGIFIVIYVLLFNAIRKWKKITSYLIIVIFAVSIVEVTMNTEKTGYSTTSLTSYLRDNNGVTKIISDLEKTDKELYRLTKLEGFRTKNDATWHNFHSTSTFSSTAYAGLSSFYGQLGMEHSTNAYAIHGATPVIYSLFNVKYLVTNKHMNENEVFTYYSGNDGEFLYKNNYSLPIGYMVPSDLNENLLYDVESNPFNVQNNFIYAATGIDHVLVPLDFEEGSDYCTFTAEDDMFVYGYVRNKTVESVKVISSDTGKSTIFDGINHGRGVDIGYVKKGTTLTLSDNGSKNYMLQMYLYTIDLDKYKEAIEKLAEGGLNISSYDDTSIKGTITSKENGLMFTSIPYDEGWTIYVDGVKTELQKIGNAFLAVPLKKGTHTISMEYRARGYNAGLIISIVSAIIIIVLIVFRIIFKKEITEEGAIELFLQTKQKKKDKSKVIESESEEK